MDIRDLDIVYVSTLVFSSYDDVIIMCIVENELVLIVLSY